MRALRATRQVFYTDRTHFIQLIRIPPDIDKTLLAYVAAWKRELHARIDVAIGRNITGRMTGAAGQRFQIIRARGRWHNAEFLNVPYQVLIAKDFLQVAHAYAQIHRRAIAIHHRSDRGVERALDS